MDDIHVASLEFIARGLPIVLARPGSKKPIGKAWQLRTWTDADVARAHKRYGMCNVGLILGERSQIIDIEGDGPDSETLFAELFEGCEPVVTPTYQSSKGKHRLFRWHPDFSLAGTKNIKLGSLEIRLGGQSLLPPSISDKFARYWLVGLDDCEVAEVDAIARERIINAAKLKRSKRRAKPATSDTDSLENWYPPRSIADSGLGTRDLHLNQALSPKSGRQLKHRRLKQSSAIDHPFA